MKYRAVRGTKDLFFEEASKFNFIREESFKICKQFGFSEVITPVLESAAVFTSQLGKENDIVNKEMYTLNDKNGELLALRPEGTASTVRMLLSNNLVQTLPLKFFYLGPMFRYERPQKGRQRQFFQLGVEHFAANTPLSDALILLLAKSILDNLNISNYDLELNTIGSFNEQKNYTQKLTDYLSKYSTELSLDSQKRLLSNPLRILDSKDDRDKKILEDAPNIIDSLSIESKEYFNKIVSYLIDMNISYKLSSKLVRGLDYYTGLVFEFTTKNLGSQNAILAGGRYDDLIKNMGGPHIPAIGFAAGIERLMLLSNTKIIQNTIKVALLNLNNQIDQKILSLYKNLFNIRNINPEIIEEGDGLTKKLKRANKLNFDFAIIIGEEELSKNQIKIKNLANSEQKLIKFDEFNEIIKFICN